MARVKSPKTRARTLPSPEEWHAEQPAARHGSVCWICSRPDVSAWLRRVVALNETGARRVTVASIHATLRDRVGYSRSISALSQCIREHGNRA